MIKREPRHFSFIVTVASKGDMVYHPDAEKLRAKREVGVRLQWADEGYILSQDEARKLAFDIGAVLAAISQGVGGQRS